MSHSNPLILHVHLDDAGSCEIGDEIWQQPLADAIRAEAEIIAECASLDLLQSPDCAGRDALRDRAVAEMTAALRQAGDTYTAPDDIAYTLTDQAQLDLTAGEDTLAPMSLSTPVVEEVLRFEELPIGSMASRRAVIRWSDCTVGEAIRWYSDEVLSPVDGVRRH